MKQLVVLSGKGGTGKTTISASFVALAERAVIVDCDVDAPDLHLLLNPTVIESQDFFGPKLAQIDQKKCSRCARCVQRCRFDAIIEKSQNFEIDPFSCEGCGVCAIVCPEKAVTLKERIAGEAFLSNTKYGFMAYALLRPAQANSGKLVTLVRTL